MIKIPIIIEDTQKAINTAASTILRFAAGTTKLAGYTTFLQSMVEKIVDRGLQNGGRMGS